MKSTRRQSGALAAILAIIATLLLVPASPASAADDRITIFNDQGPITFNITSNDVGWGPPDLSTLRFTTTEASADGTTATYPGQGSFQLDRSTGSATFTVDPTFSGTVSTRYSVQSPAFNPADPPVTTEYTITVLVADRNAGPPVIANVFPVALGNTGNARTLVSVCIVIEGENLIGATFKVGGLNTIPISRPWGTDCSSEFNPHTEPAPTDPEKQRVIVKVNDNTFSPLQGLSETSLVGYSPSGVASAPYTIPLQTLPVLDLPSSDSHPTPEGGLVRLKGVNLLAATRGRMTIDGVSSGTAPVIESGADYIVIDLPRGSNGTLAGVGPITSAGESSQISLTYTRSTLFLDALPSKSGPAAGGSEMRLTGLCVGLRSTRVFFGDQEATVLRQESIPGRLELALVVEVPPGAGTTDVYAISANTSCNSGDPNSPVPAGYSRSNSRQYTYLVAPAAVADEVTTATGRPITVDVTANDTADAASPLDRTTVQFTASGQPADAVVSADGRTLTLPGVGEYTVDATSGQITFIPEAGFVGDVPPVTYQVADGNGTATSSTLTVTVAAASAANDDLTTVTAGDEVSIPVLDNDSVSATGTWDLSSLRFPTIGQPDGATVDPAGTELTIAGAGTYRIQSDGTITFTAISTFRGTTAPIVYAIDDSFGATATASVSVDVTEPVIPTPPPGDPDTGGTPDADDSPNLAITGGATAIGTALAAALLLGTGLAMFVIRRRRSTAHE